MAETLYTISIWVVPVIIAITFHEAAHGFAAWRLGDDTAYRLGRVTFNPLKHIDPIGTVVLPAILLISNVGFVFGWAKPVPVRFGNLAQPRRDMVLVAAAGPATNLVLALASAWLLRWVHLTPATAEAWLSQVLTVSLFFNVLLAVFNMLPLPPLDGGRVAVGLLPPPLALPLARLERFGFVILIGLIFVLPMIGRQFGIDANFFVTIVLGPTRWIVNAIASIVGLQ